MSELDDQDWVRRALASARSDEPVPDPVAARLEARLAGLSAERPSPQRRAIGPYLLAAAAVAAVVAIGVPTVRHIDGAAPTSSASSAGGEAAASSATPSPSSSPSLPTTSEARLGLTGDTPRLLTSSFDRGVAAALPQLLEAAQAYALGGQEAASSCAATPAPGTRGALVLLDGKPALVQISATSGGRRTVQALSCADASPVASARVAAR